MAPQLQGQACNMKAPVHSSARAKVDLFQVVYLRRVFRRDMTEWTLLKRLLDAVHQHSTMIGRIWLTVMVIFRLLIVAVATEDVYADEQEMFECNTLQPGCRNVCYDAFAPISQPRFWVFQIITVSTPSLCFIIYTWHNLSKHPEANTATAGDMNKESHEPYARSCDSDSCSIKSHRHLGHSLANVLEGIAQSNLKSACASAPKNRLCRDPAGVKSGVLSTYYIFHVCFRAVLEIGFVFAQWLLFGFQVPAHFVCISFPCSQRVDCYVSRPTEKTIFLIFMFSVGIFCIFLNFLELNHLGWKKITRSVRLKDGSSWRGYEAINQDTHSIASLTFRDVTSTTSLPTLDLVVDHRPDWTCTGNCSPLKEERDESPQNPAGNQRAALSLKSKTHKGRLSKQRSTEVWI
ncbi:gap junction protein delta 6 [Alosa alosa]|uniref:gap junction protein delta 6 n=1 Tax=Alosa alosa TaxID=278164 RepID=UPI0020150A3E|nr:gap junction protein delta 6 [Alosa alosa]